MIHRNKLLLISGTGFLGAKILSESQANFMEIQPTSRLAKNGFLELNLENPIELQLAGKLQTQKYSHAIICAAITDIEQCYKNPELSNRINVDAMAEILVLLKKFKIKPIFFSSDLVFSNTVDLATEHELPNPSTLYGKQKLTIEKIIQQEFDDFLIFRTSKLMSMELHPRNILAQVIQTVRKQQKYNAFEDQFITPIFIEDVASIVLQAVQKNLKGIFHLAGSENLDRFQLACILAKKFGFDSSLVVKSTMATEKFSETRGNYYTLSNKKISNTLNFSFTTLDAGLNKLAKFVNNI